MARAEWSSRAVIANGTIDDVVREARRRAGVSQRELAARTGVPLSTVTRVESGEVAQPGVATLARLIAVAGLRLLVVDADDAPVVVSAEVSAARGTAGCRLPPHLNVRPVRGREDWWAYWPRYSSTADPPLPKWTYDRRPADLGATPRMRPMLPRGHRWPRAAAEAQRTQSVLRRQVERAPPRPFVVRTVAGLDAAYDKSSDLVVGAVVVMDALTLEVIDQATACARAALPYVRGLLAFRELPALAEAWDKLGVARAPDLLVCDGYGVAHPRRFGLASHVGVLTGIPTIGVAKTAYLPPEVEPGPTRGDAAPVVERGEVVARALRTRDGVKEVFVSIGHLIDLDTACEWVLRLTPRYRLPETTRAADALARRTLRDALTE